METILELSAQLEKKGSISTPLKSKEEVLAEKIEQFIAEFKSLTEAKQYIKGTSPIPSTLPLLLEQDISKEKYILSSAITLAKHEFYRGIYEKAEKNYAIAIKQALKHEKFDVLIHCLERMGDLYNLYASTRHTQSLIIRQHYLATASALYNKALFFCEELSIDPLEIQQKIIDVEVNFLKLIGKDPNEYINLNLYHKMKLQAIRKEIKKQFIAIIKTDINQSAWWEESTNILAIQALYQLTTREMKAFIGELLRECITILGIPPCGFAVIAFGSTAREEMTPFSDLEWGILIDDDQEKNKAYFRTLTNLLHLKVIGLGETSLRTMAIPTLLDIDDYNIGRKGFSFDSSLSYACKWPLGRETTYTASKQLMLKGFELICTPQNMLAYQTATGYEKSLHLATTLACVTMIATECKQENALLVTVYEEQLRRMHATRVPSNQVLSAIVVPFPFTFAQLQALDMLEDDLVKFDPMLAIPEQAGKQYNVKKDVYRLVNVLLDGLGLYFGLIAKSGWVKITEMTGKYITPEGAQQLKKLVSIVKALRLHVYLQTNTQKEKLASVNTTTLDSSEQFCHDYLAILLEMYRIVLPLLNETKIIVTSQGLTEHLKENTFYDQSLLVKGLTFFRLMQYTNALQCFLEHLKSESKLSRFITYEHLGCILSILGKYDLSILCYQMTADLCQTIPEQATTLMNIANAFGEMGEHLKKKELLTIVLAKQIQYYRTKEHSQVITTQINLADVYGKLADHNQQQRMLEEALELQIKLYKTRIHIKIARTLVYLANVLKMKDLRKAKELLEEALTIQTQHFGTKDHIQIADTLLSLAIVFGSLHELPKEQELLEEVLRIQVRHFRTTEHLQIARTLIILANTQGLLENNLGRKELLEKALVIQIEFYNTKEHAEVVETMQHLAAAYGCLNLHTKAIELLEEILFIKNKLYGATDPVRIIMPLSMLINIYGKLGEINKQTILLERVLAIKIQHYKTRLHIEIADILAQLAKNYGVLGDLTRKRELLEETLAIRLQHYKDKRHIIVITTLKELVIAYGELRDLVKKKVTLEEILALQKGAEPLTEAQTLMELAEVHRELGEDVQQKESLEKAKVLLETKLAIHPQYHTKCRDILELKACADFHDKTGDFQAKRDLLEAVLLMQEGATAFTRALTLEELAKVYWQLKELTKRVELLQKASALKPKCVKNITEALLALANIYYTLGNIDTNRCLLKEALAIQYDFYQLQTLKGFLIGLAKANALLELATIHEKLGELDKKEELLLEVRTIKSQCNDSEDYTSRVVVKTAAADARGSVGSFDLQKIELEELLLIQINHYQTREHIEVARTLIKLTRVYLQPSYRDLHRVKDLLEEALAIQVKHAELLEHLEIEDTAINLARICNELNEHLRAKQLLKEVLAHKIKRYSTRKHIQVALVLIQLAKPYTALGNYLKAKQLLEEALEIQREHYKSAECLALPETMNQLAVIYNILGEQGRAKGLLEETLTMQTRICKASKYSDEFTGITITPVLINLARICSASRDHAKARSLFEQAITLQKAYYKTNQHPEIAITMSYLAETYVIQRNFQQALEMIEQACHTLLHHPEAVPNDPTTKQALITKKQIDQTMFLSVPALWLQFHLRKLQQSPFSVEQHSLLGNYYLQDVKNVGIAINHYEKILALMPEYPAINYILARCYYVKRQAGDLARATSHFESAIQLAPTAKVFCEYGHFLYQQATQSPSPANQSLLEQAIVQLMRAITLAEDNSMLTYGKLEQPVTEIYLQLLIKERKQISIIPSCLAYYLLVKADFALGHYLVAAQILEHFEDHVAYKLSLAANEDTALQIELLLLENAKQFIAINQELIEAIALSIAPDVQQTITTTGSNKMKLH